MKQRAATIERKTKETDISLTINLDGTGENEIATGIPFFDHMLNGFARHGLFDLKVHVTGDLEVDSIIRSRIPGSYWGRQSQQHWEKKRGSSVTEAFCFLWTRHSPCVQ